MSAATTSTSPEAAVQRWWEAMRAGDLDALDRLLLDDYLSSGGPGTRTLGRAEVLEQARDFFANAEIETFALAAMRLRRHGDVAVCVYEWSEAGVHAGERFAMRGLATDVLVRAGGDAWWAHQAHHVSMVA